jgi:hypothetical protein
MLAVDGFRQQPGSRRLARAARAAEQVSMAHTIRPHRIPQRADDMFLPDHIFKRLGTPLQIKGLFRQGVLLSPDVSLAF